MLSLTQLAPEFRQMKIPLQFCFCFVINNKMMLFAGKGRDGPPSVLSEKKIWWPGEITKLEKCSLYKYEDQFWSPALTQNANHGGANTGNSRGLLSTWPSLLTRPGQSEGLYQKQGRQLLRNDIQIHRLTDAHTFMSNAQAYRCTHIHVSVMENGCVGSFSWVSYDWLS